MNPWSVNPTWQNFSSLFREAVTALDAKTEMERSHHLTASLYFGISALEAFMNERMRDYLKPTKTEDEIFNVLRKGQIIRKLKTWPMDTLAPERKAAVTHKEAGIVELAKLNREVLIRDDEGITRFAAIGRQHEFHAAKFQHPEFRMLRLAHGFALFSEGREVELAVCTWTQVVSAFDGVEARE